MKNRFMAASKLVFSSFQIRYIAILHSSEKLTETMSNDARQKNYKHRGLDSEELRKRREDLNITLRKQKREEQV